MVRKLKTIFKNSERITENFNQESISEKSKEETSFDKFDKKLIKLFGNSKLVEYRWPILFSAAILILFLFVKVFIHESIIVKQQPPSVIVQLAAPAPVLPASVTPTSNTIYAPVLPPVTGVSSVKVPSANEIPLNLSKLTEPMSPIKITDYKKVGGFENFFNDMDGSLFTELDTEM